MIEIKILFSLVKPWRIVFPAIIFTSFYIAFITKSIIFLNDGSEIFCSKFEPIFNITRQVSNKLDFIKSNLTIYNFCYSCKEHINIYTLLYNDTEKPFDQYLMLVRIGSQICLWSWIVQLIVLAIRFFTGHDFTVLIISIYSKDHVSILCFNLYF